MPLSTPSRSRTLHSPPAARHAAPARPARPSPGARRGARLPLRLGLLGAVLGTALLGGCAVWRLPEARRIADAAVAWQQQPEAPARRLLVVGDSTGVGTGASRPEDSVAGRIGRLHPDWRIDNRAVNGAKARDLSAQLAAVPGDLDLVLVMVGGNDVLRLSDLDSVQQQLDRAVAQAQARGGRVMLFPPGFVGHAPLLLPPLSWWANRRSDALHAAVQAVALQRGVPRIDIRQPAERDPFVQDPQRYHAADGLHPSSEGYALWFDALQRADVLR